MFENFPPEVAARLMKAYLRMKLPGYDCGEFAPEKPTKRKYTKRIKLPVEKEAPSITRELKKLIEKNPELTDEKIRESEKKYYEELDMVVTAPNPNSNL